MEGFDKINKFYVSATGEQLSQKSLTFTYYDTENEGSTFRLQHDEKTNTFSVKQNGQIFELSAKNKERA